MAITGAVLAAQHFYPPVRAPGVPPPQNGEIVGVISGLFLWVAVGSLSGVFLRLRQRKLLAASLAASLAGVPPRDGAKVAACGVLVADGPLLAAPLSGTPCVTYDYKISRSRNGSSSMPAIIWHGHGLTPSHVETAAGAVRILGCTGFALGSTSLKGPEVVARATKFCAETTFADSHWTSMRVSMQNRKELLADDDGAIKADFGAPATRRVDAKDMLEEHVARDQEEVCAFGRYSAERGGLVPDPSAVEGFPVILWTGDASRVRRKIALGAIGHLVGALATAAAGAGVLWAWYTLL
jgi:hypothetical protein